MRSAKPMPEDGSTCVSRLELPAVGTRIAAVSVLIGVDGTVYRLPPESADQLIANERLTVVSERTRRRLSSPQG